MAVYKSRNKWRAEVSINGKRIATKGGFNRKIDALRWHEDTIFKYRSQKEVLAEKIYNMRDLISKFHELHLPYIKTSTKDRYLLDIEKRIVPFFCSINLNKIDGILLEHFKSSIVSKMSPKSVNNCLHVLRLLLNKAIKWKMLERNPYDLDSLKIQKISSKVGWWDEKTYIRKFLQEAKLRSRYYPAFLLALETGMRLGEIVGLSKQDIDFERGRIHVKRQWSDKYKEYGSCKNGLERWVDFNPKGELAKTLKEAVLMSGHQEIIFLTSRGNRVNNRALAGPCFKHIVRKAKVPDIRFHDMRHTFASWYMIEIDEIWALKSILGHSDIRTTQRYAHHSLSRKRRSLEIFSRVSPHESHTRDIVNS